MPLESNINANSINNVLEVLENYVNLIAVIRTNNELTNELEELLSRGNSLTNLSQRKRSSLIKKSKALIQILESTENHLNNQMEIPEQFKNDYLQSAGKLTDCLTTLNEVIGF